MQYNAVGCSGCEWDPDKDAENRRKHDGITFADACCVFDDPFRDVVEDEGGYSEKRLIATGRVGNVILVVVFTERNGRERIISARKAEPRERRRYYGRSRT